MTTYDYYYEKERRDLQGCRSTTLVLFIIAVIVVISCWCNRAYGQSYGYTNRGLYPNSIQVSYNAYNTSTGLLYSYAVQRPVLGMPLGIYGYFSNTIQPNKRYCNYEWERKYTAGFTITLPPSYDQPMIYYMALIGVGYNQHPREWQNQVLPPGQSFAEIYTTNPVVCEFGVKVQIKHFAAHLKADVLNWMRYVEFGAGYSFSFNKSI